MQKRKQLTKKRITQQTPGSTQTPSTILYHASLYTDRFAGVAILNMLIL